jgi:zinc transport system permease protein
MSLALDFIYQGLSFLYEPMFMRRAALALFLLGLSASGAGVLVVSRRMAFFPEATGHTVFFGLAAGLILGLPEEASVLAFGLGMGLAITYLSRHSRLSSDTVIGLSFSGAVAAGLVMVSRYPKVAAGLGRYFLGDVLTADDRAIAFLAGLALVSFLFCFFLYDRLMLGSVSAEGMKGQAWADYLFGAYLALVVVVSVQAVGVLLVTALLVAPAACGRVLGRSGRAMFWIAMAVSLLSGQIGLALAFRPQVDASAGAMVVLMAIVFFAAAASMAAIARALRGRHRGIGQASARGKGEGANKNSC